MQTTDALHKSRLFNTEEKPFRRITTRLFAESSILAARSRFPLTPPPEDGDAAADSDPKAKRLAELSKFRDDMLLDFANFESSLIRMQLNLNSNEQERQRYAAEKLQIQGTAQEVKRSTTELHAQLQEAKNQLALRQTYDELTEKITSNRLLKPREDQEANIEKLNNEIAELERESTEYAETWAERREQFGKIVEEGMQLRRLIRDEKEEVERREGMEGRDEHEDGDNVSTRGRSTVGTPRLDAGGSTPMHAGSDGDGRLLSVDKLRSRSKSPFRTYTPIPEDTSRPADNEDVRMDDAGERPQQEVTSSPSEGLVAEDEDEEGEAKEDESEDEGRLKSMDTS